MFGHLRSITKERNLWHRLREHFGGWVHCMVHSHGNQKGGQECPQVTQPSFPLWSVSKPKLKLNCGISLLASAYKSRSLKSSVHSILFPHPVSHLFNILPCLVNAAMHLLFSEGFRRTIVNQTFRSADHKQMRLHLLWGKHAKKCQKQPWMLSA